jgi:hypothetical protein
MVERGGWVEKRSPNFLFFLASFVTKKITFRSSKILFASLDSMLGAIGCGAEVTQLGATTYGAEH